MPDVPYANLPAPIASAIGNIAQALVPSSIKALNRLVGAAIDIPVAWLERQKAIIDARTGSITGVEAAIGKSAASKAGDDQGISERAVEALVSKSYRSQQNREAVAQAFIEELSASTDEPADRKPEVEVEDDWLNVFERYAADASSDRMQKLWGRVLAGEIRQPGRYSLRTLRFLSEFSQKDAVVFAALAANAFGDFIPTSLANSIKKGDLTPLINLEAAGVIHGGSGFGLAKSFTGDNRGHLYLAEDDLVIQMRASPDEQLQFEVVALTPLGIELLRLVPGRDKRVSARNVALALRSPIIKECYLCSVSADGRTAYPFELIWNDSQT